MNVSVSRFNGSRGVSKYQGIPMVSSHLNSTSEEQNGIIVEYMQKKSGVSADQNVKKQKEDDMIVVDSRQGLHNIEQSTRDQIGIKVHGLYYIILYYLVILLSYIIIYYLIL